MSTIKRKILRVLLLISLVLLPVGYPAARVG